MFNRSIPKLEIFSFFPGFRHAAKSDLAATVNRAPVPTLSSRLRSKAERKEKKAAQAASRVGLGCLGTEQVGGLFGG